MPARELLPAECRARLFAHLGAMTAYWRDLPEAQLLAGNSDGDVTEERLTGLLFSMLTAIDGSALSLPGFLLVPKVNPDDREAADGEEYWPSAAINEGVELHAAFPFQLIPPRTKP
ncbi:hypothetical protein Kim5_CH00786 [Rhizobium sp. Kim5]|uniref:hypothetical protein n=1 Tax=Rhizobium sp. Kim5 TaxID=2020311 RepID=UPI0001905F39|nr:hypothetical protein [Rhizobium sp. Kim5]ARQ56894.1 hypothetical protein Kim5_CH00786 [Rhizobium sp. Kim5]